MLQKNECHPSPFVCVCVWVGWMTFDGLKYTSFRRKKTKVEASKLVKFDLTNERMKGWEGAEEWMYKYSYRINVTGYKQTKQLQTLVVYIFAAKIIWKIRHLIFHWVVSNRNKNKRCSTKNNGNVWIVRQIIDENSSCNSQNNATQYRKYLCFISLFTSDTVNESTILRLWLIIMGNIRVFIKLWIAIERERDRRRKHEMKIKRVCCTEKIYSMDLKEETMHESIVAKFRWKEAREEEEEGKAHTQSIANTHMTHSRACVGL